MSQPEQFDEHADGATFVGAARALRRRWVLVVGIVVACVVVAAIHAKRSPNVYKASASVAFQSTSPANLALGVSGGGSAEPQREANTEVLKAHSAEVARRVIDELHLHTTPAKLLDEVQAEVAPTANVLNIVASGSAPAAAARLANSFAEQYIAFRRESEVSGLSAAETSLQEQIEALPESSPERAALAQSAQRISELRATAGGSATIIGRASPPGSPSGTTFTAWIIVGLLVGIATASLLVFFLESLDRRIRTTEQFEREYRLPALTVVPRSAFRERRAIARADSLEPYRMLRSALEFTAAARSLHTLLVTSAVPGEGKTTAAVDFAQAVALTGRHVVLVELDMRRPAFAQHFELRERGGVSSALVGSQPVASLLEQPFEGLPTLRVLPAGRLPHNPAELLGSERMSEILTELRGQAEMVILDVPPLNPVADAQILLNSHAVDGALLVGRLDRTSRDEVRRARAILDHHAVKPVGLVIMGAPVSHAYGERYGYRLSGSEQPHPGEHYREKGAEPTLIDVGRPGPGRRQRLPS